MTADAIWAAAGLAVANDGPDSADAIFTLDRARQPLLIEDGEALSLPELMLP